MFHIFHIFLYKNYENFMAEFMERIMLFKKYEKI